MDVYGIREIRDSGAAVFILPAASSSSHPLFSVVAPLALTACSSSPLCPVLDLATLVALICVSVLGGEGGRPFRPAVSFDGRSLSLKEEALGNENPRERNGPLLFRVCSASSPRSFCESRWLGFCTSMPGGVRLGVQCVCPVVSGLYRTCLNPPGVLVAGAAPDRPLRWWWWRRLR